MAGMLSTGVSGLMAFQTALDTISNNVSNANTTGYSREAVNLVSNAAGATNGGWVGGGVSVSTITRSYDNLLAGQTRTATSSYNQLNTYSTLASNIDDMLGDSSTGLSATLTSFTSALQTLADSPSQTATRQAVLSQAQTLIAQFQSYQSTLNQLGSQVSSSISSEATTITSLGQSIASLNLQIENAQNETGQPPNQLLDERDALIDQLSTHVNVNTVAQSDGSVNVYIGSGQALVVGTTSTTLAATPDQYNSGQALVLQTVNGSVDITSSISGGTLGGDLQFQGSMLTPVQNALGQAAVTLVNLVNAQNSAGIDQNGDMGTALMAVGSPTVLASSRNAGTETVAASITDTSSLTSSNYYLKYDGSNWSLVDSSSGAAATLTASTAGTTTTLTGAGMTLTASGTAQAGDKFLIEPTASAVSGLSLLTSDPAQIAAAAALTTTATTGNTGSGAIGAATVTDAAAWTAARGDYTLSFTDASDWQVTDASGNAVANGTYTAGSAIAFNGVQVAVTGTPAAGDSFSIDDNIDAASGDNSNALLLAGIGSSAVLNGGKESLADAINNLIGKVGTLTRQAQNGATATQASMQSAQAAQQSVAGVNLDEEAANMVKFQQAYEAAAQVIKTAATLFQSILSAVQG